MMYLKEIRILKEIYLSIHNTEISYYEVPIDSKDKII